MTRRRHLLVSALSPFCGALGTPRVFASTAQPAPSLPPATGAYALPNTFVHPLPDPVSGRRYEVWVDLPPGVAASRTDLLPSVFVTDAPYAFPMVRALRHRVGQRGQNIADFVLVGLAGPADESAVDMRNRDYTPTDPSQRAGHSSRHYGGRGYGGGPAYLSYVAKVVVPAVSAAYGLDPRRRLILGHSYGALLAVQALLSRPDCFSHYILGSPSFWFDDSVLLKTLPALLQSRRDLNAQVFQYVGGYEAIGRGSRFNSEVDMVADARRFQTLLERSHFPSLRLRTQVLNGEDHLTVAPAGATQGLLWALPGRGPYTGG